MAEGFLRAYGSDAFEAYSAGIRPSHVDPLAIKVMREAGIDISAQQSKDVTNYLGHHFGTVITVCDNAKEHCPIFPGSAVREHWPFQDPAAANGDEDERLIVFRSVRDEIRAKVQRFLVQQTLAHQD